MEPMKRTFKVLGITSLTVLPLLAIPTGAHAQTACGEREAIISRLEAKWGETFVGGGLQSASSVFEVWISADKGTWTILKTSANGMACVMAAGTNWLESLPSQQIAGIKG
jgi:hypothetical protein